MLTEPFERLFSTKRLREALEHYKGTKEYDTLYKMVEEGAFVTQLREGYIPDPLTSFEIPKSNGEMRRIAMASTASKLVQKIIADALSKSVKLNDKSYAFRRGKGTLKAVARTQDFLKRYDYIAKADIDDFFDSIDHEKLMRILERIVSDRKVLMLVSLFLKNGMLQGQAWVDKAQGVYQGDTLSPVLSNIYLHGFDEALQKEGIDFVRFADDMLFFAKSEVQAKKHLTKASRYLEALSLRFGEEKSYIASHQKGFEFLGLRFKAGHITIDNDRFMKKLSDISQKTKKKELEPALEQMNQTLKALKAYYAKVLTDDTQFERIEEHMDHILIKKVMQAKRSKRINRKSRFLQILLQREYFADLDGDEKHREAHAIIAKAYEMLRLEKPLKSARKLIEKKKADYLQEQIKSSEIILAKYGLYASVSKGKLTVKEYGKVVRKVPINWVSRVIVATKGASLSTALIYECAKRKIDIDFIDRNRPYAQITYHTTISNELHLKQIAMKNAPEGLLTAKAIVKAKMKNQLNLVKYHARYREENDAEEFALLEALMLKMQKLYKKVPKASDTAQLMGHEGAFSVLYWQAFGILIDRRDFKRVTQDAPDAINQALNYGYAFIYNRVQSALLKTGVNIYHSFLHVPQANKPTLVYDMVEMFRQPVVDREIISILNLGTELHSVKGKLDKKSLRVVTENVQERLATPTRWRKGKYKLATIIEEQALELAHTIKGTQAKFKGFVARY